MDPQPRQPSIPPVRQSPWADLNTDILECIYLHLCPRDRGWFGAVCQSWRLARHESRLYVPLPCGRTYRDKPCRGTTAGWLLFGGFSLGDDPFFFKPLPLRRVYLPRWRWKRVKPQWDAIISSAPPTDQGCKVVFLVGKRVVHWKHGDRKWSSCTAGTNLNKSTGAFFGDKLYFINQHQDLSVVDLDKRKDAVTWLGFNTDPLWARVMAPVRYGKQFLVESEGKLLLAFFCGSGECHLFSADFDKQEWREERGLGNRALFLAPGGSVSVVAKEVGVRPNWLYFALKSTKRRLADVSLGPSEAPWSAAKHLRDNVWIENESERRYFKSKIDSPTLPRWLSSL